MTPPDARPEDRAMRQRAPRGETGLARRLSVKRKPAAVAAGRGNAIRAMRSGRRDRGAAGNPYAVRAKATARAGAGTGDRVRSPRVSPGSDDDCAASSKK